MARCPNCDAEIDELYYEGMVTGHIVASITDGELKWEYREDEESQDEDECYRCPCCDAIVAHDDDEAKEILLGL